MASDESTVVNRVGADEGPRPSGSDDRSSTGTLAGPASLPAPSRDRRREEDPLSEQRPSRQGFLSGTLHGPRAVVVVVGALTIAGFLLRIPSFYDSLAGDEISTYFIVVGTSLGRVLRLVHSNQETTPPLYFLVAWASNGLLGHSVQSIRLVSLVTGTASIPLTFVIGTWTLGRRAALVGASCVALSPYMIYFSTEARPYMLALFLVLVSTVALLRALDTGRVTWWVLYAVASCGAAYTHYTVVFILVGQLAWALWTQPKARPALIVANAAAVIGYLPWLGGLREDLSAQNFISLTDPVNYQTIKNIFLDFWIGHPVIPFQLLPGRLAVVLAASGLVLGVVGLVLRARTHSVRWPFRSRNWLVLVLAVGPAVLMVSYSWLREDVLGGGNIIASWPALALTIGALVTAPSLVGGSAHRRGVRDRWAQDARADHPTSGRCGGRRLHREPVLPGRSDREHIVVRESPVGARCRAGDRRAIHAQPGAPPRVAPTLPPAQVQRRSPPRSHHWPPHHAPG
jgi:Dolichyl-phosphate-mannose-protein mannosyltransferase